MNSKGLMKLRLFECRNIETINRIYISEVCFWLGTYKGLKNATGSLLIYECYFGPSRSNSKENQNNIAAILICAYAELDFLNQTLCLPLLKQRRKYRFSVQPNYQRCPISGTFPSFFKN